MKYNKSEIMKKAWEIFRNNHFLYAKTPYLLCTFSDALKSAWESAKRNLKKEQEIADKMSKRIVELFDGDCFINTVTGVIGGYSTYHHRSTFKKHGFKWQYAGGTAYEFNRDGFAWVGSVDAVCSIIRYAI